MRSKSIPHWCIRRDILLSVSPSEMLQCSGHKMQRLHVPLPRTACTKQQLEWAPALWRWVSAQLRFKPHIALNLCLPHSTSKRIKSRPCLKLSSCCCPKGRQQYSDHRCFHCFHHCWTCSLCSSFDTISHMSTNLPYSSKKWPVTQGIVSNEQMCFSRTSKAQTRLISKNSCLKLMTLTWDAVPSVFHARLFMLLRRCWIQRPCAPMRLVCAVPLKLPSIETTLPDASGQLQDSLHYTSAFPFQEIYNDRGDCCYHLEEFHHPQFSLAASNQFMVRY